MIKLTKVVINKYKSIQKPQIVEIGEHVTTIVGMNESGKTNFLEVIAKTNYFNDDPDFKFDITQDYPRNDLIEFQGNENDEDIIICHYNISQELLKAIESDIGKGIFEETEFTYTCHYKKKTNSVEGITANQKRFIDIRISKYVLSNTTKAAIKKISKLEELAPIDATEGDDGLEDFKTEIKKIIDIANKTWENKLESYIFNTYIKPNMPKYWYFDDYYHLPGKINIDDMLSGNLAEKNKTAKALFELARIEPSDILNSTEYEKYVAQLEASSNKITSEIFKYWSTNRNLDIEFRIQDVKKNHPNGQEYIEKYLDIRVKNQRHKISLPLDRRSKGFSWFFSFIIWFSKIQADKKSDYVLLLDEPGLNLHASAQADLLRFINDLSKKYQIILTTHSPFMVESDQLTRVRTCLDTDEGTVISDTIQEKDPNTLFPLQAALGYDIAQNLFVSKNNLLVEGPADLIYLTVLSNLLEADGREGLKDTITIVPVGGLDKVTTFISLLRGSKLNVVCLLDTFTDEKGKQKVNDLIRHKIIKEKNIRFFDEFTNNGKNVADIEDLFEKQEILTIFNAAFEKEYKALEVKDLDPGIHTIVKQINKAIAKERFNHYRPANKLNQMGVEKSFFTSKTLDNFERMFSEINKLF